MFLCYVLNYSMPFFDFWLAAFCVQLNRLASPGAWKKPSHVWPLRDTNNCDVLTILIISYHIICGTFINQYKVACGANRNTVYTPTVYHRSLISNTKELCINQKFVEFSRIWPCWTPLSVESFRIKKKPL